LAESNALSDKKFLLMIKETFKGVLERLNNTQQQLFQSEKLVSLGVLSMSLAP